MAIPERESLRTGGAWRGFDPRRLLVRARLSLLVVSSLVAGIAGFEMLETSEPMLGALALGALIVSLWLAWFTGRRADAAHAQLADSEARFRGLTEMSSDFYWESDVEHRLTRRASAIGKLSTVSAFQRDVQIGEQRWEIPYLSPDEAGWQAHRAVLDAHLPFRGFEISRLGADGTERHISLSGDPVFNASGVFKGYRGIGTDVTERKRAEEALAQFKQTLDQTQDSVFMFREDDFRFIYVNDGAKRQVGYTEAEMLRMTPLDIKPEFTLERFQKMVQPLRDGTQASLAFETVHRHKDGHDFPVEIVLQLSRNEGRASRFVAIVRDISERKRADRLMRQITEGTASTTGEEFMRNLTRTLAEALGVRYAFIGEFAGPARDRVRVISFWNGLEYAEPFEYALAGTPCKTAVEEGECFYPAGVQELFTQDDGLVRLGVNSYLGIRLRTGKGEPLGLLTVMHTRKLEQEVLASSVMRIFAARASAELERLQSTEALERSQRRFAKVFRSSPLAVVLTRLADGKLLDMNEAACQLFGHTREEMLGRTSLELGFWVDASDRERIVEELRRTGAVRGTEHLIRRKSGEIRMVQDWLEYIELDGESCVVGSLLDVTERDRAEKKLRKRGAHLHLLTENIPAAVAYVDRDLMVRVANQRYVEMHCGAGGEAVGRPVRELVGERAWPQVERNIARVFAGESLTYERALERADGERREIEVHFEPDRSPGGKVRGYYAFILDITERKRAEKELRKRDARLRLLTENMPAAVAYIDRDLVIQVANQRYVELRSAPGAEVIGRHVREVAGEKAWPELARKIAKVFTGESLFYETTLEHPDGGRREVEVHFEPDRSPGGEVRGYYAFILDITERKRADQMLRLEHAVTQALAGADSVLGTVESVLRAVCETEGWECGRYFELDEKAAVLRFGIAWSMPEENAQRFIAGWRDATYTPGVGLPGHVWQTAQPLWVADGDKDRRASRPKLGRDTGMHSAFLFPILSEGKTIGVMAFNSRKVREPDERLLQAAGVIGSQIGQFLQRTRAQQALRLRDRALDASVNAIMITDSSHKDGPIVYVNPAFERNTGYTAAEVQGRNPRFLLGTDTDQPGLEEMRMARAEEREGSALLRNYRKDGTQFWNELHIAPVRDPQGRVTHFVGVQNDVTERVRYQAEIERQANFDSLTGLANRNLLSDRLRQAIVRVERAGRVGAVLFLDLDRFKVINDSLGHPMGDRVLAQVAWRLSEAVRGDDTVARAGGDEFVVVLTDLAREEDVAVIAQKLLGVVASPLSVEGHDFLLGTSIGVALFPRDGTDPDVLLKHADVALYRAKESGGGGVAFFAQEMNERAVKYFNIERDLRHALERAEFVLHYQPIITMASGQIVGAEALIRWRRESGQMVSPMDFIPVAEESGLIVPIGAWVLREAAARAREWNADGRRQLSVAVNLSARQFRDPKLVEIVRAVLAETGLEPRLLNLEITESTVMHNAEDAITALLALQEIGVSLSVDDFGTGYSSLSYLKRLPLDHLKVDRSFVKDIPANSDDMAITRAVIELAHSLELEVVAEGVETDAQRKFLLGQGCDYAQGYLFSKPIDAEAFRALLNERGDSAAIENRRPRRRAQKR